MPSLIFPGGIEDRIVSKEIELDPSVKGVRVRLVFDNDYGASVIQTAYSHGHEQGLYEIGCTKKDRKGKMQLDMDPVNPIFAGDVKGYLTGPEVKEIILKILTLPLP